jgi:hypothetical protein
MDNKEDKDSKINSTETTKSLSKHKEMGKHRLSHDIIFKGKKDEVKEDEYTSGYSNNDFSYDPQSIYRQESNGSEYTREKDLKEKVYKTLLEETDINFLNNRRKPSRVDFNKYFNLLKDSLDDDNFTSIQVFNELAYYFSDNLFNMFKLLDNRWRDMIIFELQEHIGKTPSTSKEVKARNLTTGSEIQFDMETEDDGIISVTGIIISADYEEKEYEVNSYENIYIVPQECITEILNNQKFKYNLNKLNNLDIL